MMKEWDNKVFRCDTCDNLLLWEKYDDDARMCVDCAPEEGSDDTGSV
jgi:Zn ribbon nucleic-acid-binding protein